jgi:1,2-diacylglycerol 3-beta-galactosyltransferase
VAPGQVQHALDRPARRGQARLRTSGLGTSRAELEPASETRTSVLILFSDTGGGHRAAAKALDGALRSLAPDLRITWCDPLIGQGRAVARRLASLYPTIIKRAPTTWGAIFHASNTAPSFATIRAALRAQLVPVLGRALAAADPDVVLSVHPLLNHVTAALLRREGRGRALMTVVTDLVDVHRGWACRVADLVVVPTGAAERAARRWVPADRVRLLGMPVDLRFRPPTPGEQAAIRRHLGLEEVRPTVLVTGGGEGSGGLFDQVRTLCAQRSPWQVIVVCGRNERVRQRLLRVRFETPALVLGFVDDMPELMRAADVVVGKAGPGAISEALATGLPLVLTSYLPGQERSNVRFVVESGVGRYAPRAPRLLAAVFELLCGDEDERRQMRARAAALTRPDAAVDAAAACLELAARYRAASQASR